MNAQDWQVKAQPTMASAKLLLQEQAAWAVAQAEIMLEAVQQLSDNS